MKTEFQDIIDQLDEQNQTQAKETKDKQDLDSLVGSNDAVQRAIIDTTKILIQFMADHKGTVSVDNHPEPVETVKTPDVDKVVIAVASLEKTIKQNHVTDKNTVQAIRDLSNLMEKLPQQIVIPETKIPDSVTVKNQVDYSTELSNLAESIKKIDVRPEVKVTPKVDVKTDSKDVIKAIEDLKKSVDEKPVPISIPTDLTPLINTMMSVKDSVDNQKFPIPNYVLPFKDVQGRAVQVQLDASGNVPTSGGGGGSTTVDTGQKDVFNQQIIGTRNNQLEIDFSGTDPDSISLLTVTKTNGGDATTSGGQAVFSTSTNTSGEIKAVTTRTVTYHPHAENYAAFTAIFTTGIANSFQRIGLYDDNNGFFIGYEGTSFGVTKRSGAVDVTTAQASFSEDTLSGQAGSGYTRDGVVEAADFTKDNLFRIRYGWLGAAPIYYEILNPDGEWVTFHIIRHPNTSAVPSVEEPNQPLRIHIKKTTAGATNLTVSSACWAAGTSSDLQKLTATIYDETLVKPVRAILTAKLPNGSYDNIDATAGGNLKVSVEEQEPQSTMYKYGISDIEATSTYKYFGFEANDGKWYIMRKTLATKKFEYVSGSSAYSTAWTNRASQTYTDYATAF